jgi:hypothetical protein
VLPFQVYDKKLQNAPAVFAAIKCSKGSPAMRRRFALLFRKRMYLV